MLIANETTEQNNEIVSYMVTILVIGIAILIASFMLAYFLSDSITRPLRQTNSMLKDIAEGQGDLTQRLTVDSNDEVGELAANFNKFIEKLWDTVNNVAATAEQLSTSSANLSINAAESNEQVNQQASATEQVAYAIGEMSTTVHEVSKNAHQAASAADEADKQASEGRNTVQATIESIENLANDVKDSADVIARLKTESENIGSVLDVIKSIAEQTNLLALNAAIEAARAGDQGRGFAVVADEVRTLAQRTQESTREIENMIESLQQGVSNAESVMSGSRSRATQTLDEASNASTSLQGIAESVSSIKDMITQIATAAEQQSSASSEINTTVESIQQISRLTLSGSENTMGSSKELADLGVQLRELVKQFKV